MKTPPWWFRLAVDLDPALNPIGSHLESWTQDQRQSLVVRPLDGPFDSPLEVFGYCLDEVAARWGRSLDLLNGS